MTKEEELGILKEAIEKLGFDSYLGPWLMEIVDQVRRMVTCDVFPDILPKACARQIKENQEKCQKDCEQMVLRANDHAKRIGESAREEASRLVGQAAIIKERLKQRLHQMANEL